MCQCGFCGTNLTRRSHGKSIDKAIIENRRKKLIDLMLDDKITKKAYDEKYEDLCKKLTKVESEKLMFLENTTTQTCI